MLHVRPFVPAVLLVAWTLVGCGGKDAPNSSSASSASAAAGTKVQIILDWRPEPEFGGFYAAKQNGAFAKHGLDVELKNAPEQATWQAVAAGKTQFATTAADQVLAARASDADVVAVFAVYQTSPQGIMAHRARGFKTIGDVFTHDGELGAEDNAWLHFCLNKYGKGSLRLTAPGEVADFLRKPDRSMQCFVTSEPITAEKQGGDPQTFLVADAGFNPYVTVLITSGETLRKQPDLVKGVVAASREGWRAYLDDPSAANVEIAKLNSDMDLDTLTKMDAAQKPLIETDETKAIGLGAMTKLRWDTLARQLLDLKQLDKAPDTSACFVNP